MEKSESNTSELADSIAPEIMRNSAYRVLSPVLHGVTEADQRRYEPGETIALADHHAAPLLACGAVEPLAE